MRKPHAVTKHASIGPERRKVSETTQDTKPEEIDVLFTTCSGGLLAVDSYRLSCFDTSRSALQARQSIHVCYPLTKDENTQQVYAKPKMIVGRTTFSCPRNAQDLRVPFKGSMKQPLHIHKVINKDVIGALPKRRDA